MEMSSNGNQYTEIMVYNFTLSVKYKYLVKMCSFVTTDASVVAPDAQLYYSSLKLPPVEPAPVAVQNQQKVPVIINKVLSLLQSESTIAWPREGKFNYSSS
jgi:hypothetical protein